MPYYKSKLSKIPGTSFDEVHNEALKLYKKIKAQTRRKPYLRSAYFRKEKIFLELYWTHLFSKPNWRDRSRRLKYFPCALDLIKNSRTKPNIKNNPNKKGERLYRFEGESRDGEIFYVQIKEKIKSKQKCLISVFPDKK